jgi:hypothetical protein
MGRLNFGQSFFDNLPDNLILDPEIEMTDFITLVDVLNDHNYEVLS